MRPLDTTVLVILCAIALILGALLMTGLTHPEQFVVDLTTEKLPPAQWVPRVPGSNNTPTRLGQCGQVHEVVGGRAIFHRIECPPTP